MRHSSRYIALPALLMLLAASAFSQVRIEPGVVLGIGLFDWSETDPTGGSVSTPRTGLLAGGILNIAFSSFFSIEPGILYSQRGGSIGVPLFDTSGNFIGSEGADDNFNYLAIPINVKVKYPVAPGITSYGLAGVNLAILLSASETDTYAGQSTTMDIRSSLNAVDFGLDIGAGAEVTVGPVVPFLEFSYLFGVANISSVAGSTLYNNGFEIKAGIRFRS